MPTTPLSATIMMRNNSGTRYPSPQLGKGRVLREGTEVALLGYGTMTLNCLAAQKLLAERGVSATVADMRFCKPLDKDLIRQLAAHHRVLITVEEGSVGGFSAHVLHFMTLDGLLDDGKVKVREGAICDTRCGRRGNWRNLGLLEMVWNSVFFFLFFFWGVDTDFSCSACHPHVSRHFCQFRPMVLPDRFIEHGAPKDQLMDAGLSAAHIASTALNLVGNSREALQVLTC